MKKLRLSNQNALEDYLMNNSEFRSDLPRIRIHSFCHSRLQPAYRPKYVSYPYISASLVLSGEDDFINADGDRILSKAGTFSVADLTRSRPRKHHNQHFLERYFVLFEVNHFLRNILDRLFPAGLPKGKAPDLIRIQRCFEDIRKVLRKPGETDDILLGSMGFRLLTEASRQFSPRIDLPEPLILARSYIDSHYCNPALTRARIVKASGISGVSLGKMFLEHLHETVNQYVISCRLEKARLQLENSGLPISEIALQCGFSYPHYFANVFKGKYGMTPGDYRRKIKGE